MTKRVAIYVRVSTDGQTVENQRLELEEVAKRHGWHIVGVFADDAISGTKTRNQRPAMHRMMQGVTRRDFDLIAAWSVDRLGRSLVDLLGFLGEIHAKGVDLYMHRIGGQALDTSTPAGKALFQMMGVFAEFERSMIVERVNAGLRRARKEGKRLGRPPVAPDVEKAVRKSLAAGNGILKTTMIARCGSGTVQRIRRAMMAEGAI